MAGYLGQIHRPTVVERRGGWGFGHSRMQPEGVAMHLSIDRCQAMLQERPDDANAWNSLGAAYIQDARWGEAEQACTKALELDPNLTVAMFNMAMCQAVNGDYRASIALYRRMLELEPDYLVARGNLIFCIDLMEETTPEEALAERIAWRTAWPEKASYGFEHLNRDPDRPLRVGYVSSQWVDHSSTRCFAPVVGDHDRTAVETYIYCCRPPEMCDDITKQFQEIAASGWRWAHDLSGGALADLIYSDQIDILVDLAGHTEGGRLRTFCLKPAPIQATAWGYITGTGCPEVDYLMADPVLIPPEEEQGFVERIAHLPCVIPFEPHGDFPLIERPPALRQDFITFGCLNRASKITEQTFDLFAAVLDAVPRGRMLFKAHDYEQPKALERVLYGMTSRGIARGRIGVLGKSTTFRHLATYEGVDLCLDPSPHSGGLTACEGLWMGVPMVTLVGRRPVSRLSASFLSAIGLPEFIATTPQEYVDIAVRTVSNLQRLATLRATMRERMRRSPMMGAGYVRAVEQVYRRMWHRWVGA